MRISFDVSKSDISEAVPLLALTDEVLKLTVEVDGAKVATKKKAEKQEPHLYGAYWQRMFAKSFQNWPDFQEFFNCGLDHVHQALRDHFKVEHLSESVGPRQFESFIHENGLSEGLITLSRNAEIQAAEKDNA